MTTKTTKANRIKAVKTVFSLMKNGASLSDARAVAASEHKVSSQTIANWQTSIGEVVKTSKVNNESALPIIEYTFSDMSDDIRGVLKSVVNQDGRYTTREAGVIGKLYGAELTRAKLLLEVHKHNTKVSSKVNKSNILTIS